MMSRTTVRTNLVKLAALMLILCGGGAQTANAESTKTKTKASVIDEIVSMTLPSLPVEMHKRFFEGMVAMAPEFVHESMVKGLTDEVDKDPALSEAQKSDLKAKIPDLLTRADPAFRRIIKEKFGTVESFLVQGLKSDLSTLTIGEVIEVHTFLASDAGKSYLKAIQTISRNMTAGKPKPLELEEKYAAQISDFLASVPGKKYNDAMLGSADQMQDRIGQLMVQVFEEINKDAELDRMHTEFKNSV